MHMSPKRSQSHQRKIRSTYGSEGWGPIGDHTLSAAMNDLRVCARLAWPQTDRALVVTSGNALPRFSGGQVVAGSNPVSPTDITAGQRPDGSVDGSLTWDTPPG